MIELLTTMLASRTNPGQEPVAETRNSFLSLRCLLIILASYLTVLSYVGAPQFNYVFGFAVMFARSNIALSLLPLRLYQSRQVQRSLSVVHSIFVTGGFSLLRQPQT